MARTLLHKQCGRLDVAPKLAKGLEARATLAPTSQPNKPDLAGEQR